MPRKEVCAPPLAPSPPRPLELLQAGALTALCQADRRALGAFSLMPNSRDYTFGIDGLKEYARARGK